MTDPIDEIIAGLGFSDGEPGAGQDPPPQTQPPSIVASDSEQATDAPESPESPVAEPEPEDAAALQARLAEIESELQARKDAEAQAQRNAEERQAYEQQLQAWQAQQALEQEGQALTGELNNVDPEWGTRLQNFLRGVGQQRDQFGQRAIQSEHGLFGLAKAAETILTPEQFQAVADLANELVTEPSQVHMDQRIAQRRQMTEAQRTAVLEKEREIAELRLRIEAMSRPPQADAVDAGGVGAAGRADWQNATTFDEFFDGMIAANTSVG